MDESGLPENGLPDAKKMRCSDTNADLNEPSEKSNDQSWMVLIDDCLLHLFKFLKPMDLANFAKVDAKLDTLAKQYIERKYKIQFDPNVALILHNQQVRINEEVLQAFFPIFGRDIVKLTLHRQLFDHTFNHFRSMDRILCLIQNYCSLKEMTLIRIGINGLTGGLFTHLEWLALNGCSVSREWKNMKQLTTLKLETVIFRRWPHKNNFMRDYDNDYLYDDSVIPIPFDKFGSLKDVQLMDVNVENENVIKLIKSNRNIKSLS